MNKRIDPPIQALLGQFALHLADVTQRPVTPSTRDSSAWRDAMRLLVERDGVPVEEVSACIRWLGEGRGAAEFWRPVVQSPAGLRKHWTKIIAQARRENGRDWADRNRAIIEAAEAEVARERGLA